MPRKRREKSQTDIYHIMLRGINRQQIFFDVEDYQYFLYLLKRYKTKCGYEIYAYCLMKNHIHLLMRVKQEPLETVFRRIGSSFVYWYNLKYKRVGHLFQDRFRSEPVNDERYFTTVLRYILRNPVEAGICSTPEAYPYSSGKEYLLSQKGISDTAFPLEIMTRESWKDYICHKTTEKCLEMDDTIRMRCPDSTAKEMILREFGTLSPRPGSMRNRWSMGVSMRRLIDEGITIRQVSRLTGMSRKMIENIIKS